MLKVCHNTNSPSLICCWCKFSQNSSMQFVKTVNLRKLENESIMDQLQSHLVYLTLVYPKTSFI